MRTIFKLSIIILSALLVAVVIVFSLAAFDVGSYTPSSYSSLILPSKGSMKGTAVVVFDPGMSGAAKTVASNIAGDLQNSGYQVCLAGIRSQSVANISSFNIVVTGGPCYLGKIASSVQHYLRTCNIGQNAIVGAFGIGSITPENNSSQAITQEVTALPKGNCITINASIKIVGTQDIREESQIFVNELLNSTQLKP